MQPDISKVYVIFKTHLDLGFTDFAGNIVHRYIADYIPSALRLASETRKDSRRFVWTIGSWLAYKFLEKASSSDRRLMENAILAGDIHWHALPFTTHTELMDEELFREGLRYSQRLDERFGRKTSAAKMTDVPGHTRAIVPLLAQREVRLLHIGVNPASTVPSVPPVFLWRSEGAEVIVIYEKDYGATTLLPGGFAVSVNLTGDNLGPQNPSEIAKVYAGLRKRFPCAALRAASLNRVADDLWPKRHSLPVVTSEIGDTWIHGVGTDPIKVARFRCLCRLRSRWIQSGKIEAGGKEDMDFAENLLLIAEHTWGMDIKTHLCDWREYSPQDLQRALRTSRFRTVARSWEEQRAYLDAAIKALPARLVDEAKAELDLLRPSAPKRKRMAQGLKQAFRLGNWSVEINSEGAIKRLFNETNRQTCADERHLLGELSYQLFSPDDYRRFYGQYNTLDLAWARDDFTKPHMPAVSFSGWHRPRLLAVDASSRQETYITLGFDSRVRNYGAPAEVSVFLQPQPDGLDLRLEWKQKKANRIAEALWLSFNPKLSQGAPWTLEKLGCRIDPLDVVRNGNKHLHAVSGPIRSSGLSILSLDVPLVAPGRPSLLDFHNRAPALRAGISFNLYNNVWGTNFPMWYSDNAVFRYRLRWKNLKPLKRNPPG